MFKKEGQWRDIKSIASHTVFYKKFKEWNENNLFRATRILNAEFKLIFCSQYYFPFLVDKIKKLINCNNLKIT
jgi:hypothetical protein